jgi:hypothetical protein
MNKETNMKTKAVIVAVIASLQVLATTADAQKKEEVTPYKVKTAGLPGGLGASVDASGNIMGVAFAASGLSRDVAASTRLAGCEVQATKVETAPGGGLLVRKTWKAGDGHTFSTVESFTPAPAGIRWEITISDDAPPWSTEIETHFRYPAAPGVKWWTAWGSPYGEGSTANINHEDVANAIIPTTPLKVGDWQDPLVAVPLRDSHYHYGAPPYSYDEPRTAFCPFQGDLFCIPMVSVMEEKEKQGLSIALSPEDLLLDLGLSTKADGTFVFQRMNHRIGGGRPVKFAMDLVAHQPDWRAALGWLVRRYPAFFNPVVPAAHEIAGTGAYTRNWLDFDVEKMKKMAFMLNWKASHDFPYMGMFLPPVGPDHTWPGFWRGAKEPHVSIARMADYAAGMRKHGFHVLSYFNVTEFGTDIKYPAPPRKAASDDDLWKDANDFLHARLADAILYTPSKQKPFKSQHYGLTEPDKPFWTWGKAVVLDPGEPVYQKHLLEQARRHILEIPDASGICIDRMDWLRMYNHRRDDGVSWFGGQPVRSLYTSWSDLMGKLGPVFHDKGKVIYVNNHIKRLEQMRFVDGIFDEFTRGGTPLNTIALLGVRKPVMGWINKEENFQPNADDAMQKYFYLGVFPMAPFPANDHSLHPSPWVDRLYLDYGPLLSAMRGKKWVLTPRCVETTTPGVKVNLFEVFGGYALPVAFAGKAETATVQVRDIPDLEKLKAVALHPGVDTPAPVASNLKDGVLTLTVPLVRGCAMVKLSLEGK